MSETPHDKQPFDLRFFSYLPEDGGVEFHETFEKAKNRVEQVLNEILVKEPDAVFEAGEMAQMVYGRVLGGVTLTVENLED